MCTVFTWTRIIFNLLRYSFSVSARTGSWEVLMMSPTINFWIPSHWTLGSAFHRVLITSSRIWSAKYLVCWWVENSRMASTRVHASGCSLNVVSTCWANFCYITSKLETVNQLEIEIQNECKLAKQWFTHTNMQNKALRTTFWSSSFKLERLTGWPVPEYIQATTLSNWPMSRRWLKSNSFWASSNMELILDDDKLLTWLRIHSLMKWEVFRGSGEENIK